jgi:hypothetical protein
MEDGGLDPSNLLVVCVGLWVREVWCVPVERRRKGNRALTRSVSGGNLSETKPATRFDQRIRRLENERWE